MYSKTHIDYLTEMFNGIFEEYVEDVTEAADSVCNEVAKYARDRLVQTSPRTEGTGKHYAYGWTSGNKKDRTGRTFRVWNRLKPGLTHLLEFGHATRDGGYTRAFPHIALVEAECAQITGDKVAMEVGKIK